MATAHQVQAALQEAISGALIGVTPFPDVGIGWPPENRLQDIVRAGAKPVVSVYDRRLGRNTTRWLPFSYEPTIILATLTSAISSPRIAPAGSATITLGGTVTAGDAVSAVLTNTKGVLFSGNDAIARQVGAQVVIGATGSPTDTPTTMAAALSAAINGDAVLSLWVTAVAAGAVVALTAKSGIGPLLLVSNTGNGGTQTREIGRRDRYFQIACWTANEIDRQAVTDPIDLLLAQTELNFGLTLPDGSIGRLIYGSDYYIEDGTLVDSYRRDFLCTIDYPITEQDRLYAILAPELAQEVEIV